MRGVRGGGRERSEGGGGGGTGGVAEMGGREGSFPLFLFNYFLVIFQKRKNEEENDSESAFGSGVIVKKQEGLKFGKLPAVTKNLKVYRQSAERPTVDDPSTTDKISIIFASLYPIMSLLPTTSRNLLEGIFGFLGFIVVSEGVNVLLTAPNIPGVKKSLDPVKLPSITHLNTFAVTILSSYPALLTNNGTTVILYIPTPELLCEVKAVHRSGFLNMHVNWDINKLVFDDEDKFTIIEVSIKAPDITVVHKQVLRAFCIVACNLLEVEKKIQKASEPLLSDQIGFFINTVMEKIYLLVKHHTQIAFAAPDNLYSIVDWVLAKDKQSTSKDLYVELLTSILDGFERAAKLFKPNPATLEGTPQQALGSASANVVMQEPNENPAASQTGLSVYF